MNNKGMNLALGLGLAGAAVGMYIYNNSKPHYQRQIQKGIHEAVDELSDMVDDLGDRLRERM